ncbi:hypothetical protein Ancab_038953 [Ancistrocladus abbreviatus]
MRRGKLDACIGITRQRSVQILVCLGFLYMIFMGFEVPLFFNSVSRDDGVDGSSFSFQSDTFSWRAQKLDSEEELQEKEAPFRPLKRPLRDSALHSPSSSSKPLRLTREYKTISGLNFDWRALNSTKKDGFFGFA